MRTLQGLSAPAGEGIILEVHADILTMNPSFNAWMEENGLANDPFEVFHPAEYVHHMTGRTRVPQKNLSDVVPSIEQLIGCVIVEARHRGIELYTELELERDVQRFSKERSRGAKILDGFKFVPTGMFGGAKADIHVKFETGTVSREAREYLLSKHFYWVSTPPTTLFPAEEIATLQVSSYGFAKRVYEALVTHPLEACTGIHLEQKLSMRATRDDLPMPEVISVEC